MILYLCLFIQAEDGIRDLVRSRGLGDVYKRQRLASACEGAQRGPRLPQHAARVRAVAVR